MIIVFSVLLAVCCFATRGIAFTCPPCDPSIYPCPDFDTSQCLYEIVKDPCGCCPECAKGPGEECGGIFRIAGQCTNGSLCLLSVEYGLPYSSYIQTKGTCDGEEGIYIIIAKTIIHFVINYYCIVVVI